MSKFELCSLYQTLNKKYPEEFQRILQIDSGGNVDGSFLGFTDIYQKLSQIIPKYFTILDLGCCYGFQSYYFRNHKTYIGVDLTKDFFKVTDNSNFWSWDIDKFIEKVGLKGFEPLFVICSYVPINTEKIRQKFNNLFVFYPSGSCQKEDK